MFKAYKNGSEVYITLNDAVWMNGSLSSITSEHRIVTGILGRTDESVLSRCLFWCDREFVVIQIRPVCYSTFFTKRLRLRPAPSTKLKFDWNSTPLDNELWRTR